MKSEQQWQFQRPYRTRGMRIYNGLAEALRKRGLKRPIRAGEVMKRASRQTRLSDWGEESFREPLEKLIDAFESEADPTPVGRVIFRVQLIQFLCNRLRIQAALRENPAVADAPVERPLFVVGLPRTGTTLLYNLLAQNERYRPLLIHETMFPMGAKMFGRRTDGRARARWVVGVSKVIAPGLDAVHPLSVETPEECTWLLANTFTSPYFALLAHIPSYQRYLFDLGRERLVDVYRYYRLQLQLLQRGAGDGPARWVLKSPAHLFALDALLDVFPDACVVLTHRDPLEVIPSTCSLMALVRGVYSDSVDPTRLGPEVVELLKRLRTGASLDLLQDERVLPVDYEQLVASPQDTVESIYSHFDLEIPSEMPSKVRSWLDTSAKKRRVSHQYDLGQFGLSEDDVVTAFQTVRAVTGASASG